MNKRNIIIDCDPGIDDAIAIMLACACEELNILGLTVASGNIPGEQCAENALYILKLMDRLDIPVFLGETRPMSGRMVTAEETHSANGLGDITYDPVTEVRYTSGDVGEFYKAMLSEFEDISIIALGPLTNLAKLIKTYPEVLSRIVDLTIMGGAYKSHGNCSPVAEFNFWADPVAAEIVLNELNRPITLVPLDVTRDVVLTPNHIELLRQFNDPKADFIADISKFYIDYHWQAEGTLGCVINDPLAVAAFLDPSLCTGEAFYVDIITEGKAIGMSMVDTQGILNKKPNALVQTEVDSGRALSFILSRIFPDHRNDLVRILSNPRYGM